MKTLPTLGVVLDAANRAARRFPLVLASGVLAATAGIFLFNASEEEPYVRLLATATLGLPLFFALTLTGDLGTLDQQRDVPAIVMLWLAIGKRVAQYGVTERRYFMIVLSLWWAGIAIYYTLGRSRNIKVIPATLCLLGLVTFLGPWGAYRVSLASQRGRLDRLVTRYGLHTTVTPRDIPFADRKEIAATLRYLL